VTNQLRGVIDAILVKSDGPVIVVLQSDHGPDVGLDTDHPDTEGLKAKAGILNAYYVPEECRALLYPTISPVNTYRVLFSCVFGRSYPLLEDVSYIGYDDFVPLDEVLRHLGE
jgi:hypothetical protein